MLGELVTARRYERALLPPSVDEYVPADDPARFVVETVEQLNFSRIEARYSTDRGRKSYDPAMLLSLWIYGYIEGI